MDWGAGNSWQHIALQQKMARLWSGGGESRWKIVASPPHTLSSPVPVPCDTPRATFRLLNTTSDGRV